MSDQRFEHTVGAWLRDEDAAPPDSQRSARQVATRLPQVPQQSRWWPLPLLRRRPAPPTVIPHTNPLPPPIPATNGLTPTAIGRTHSMFSPVKAVTAGAVVFALGGMLLIAQPFDRQGGIVPGAAEPQPAMSEFSGRLGCGTAVPSLESVAWQFPVVAISDERFDGSYVNQLAGYEDGDPDVDGIGAYSALWEITNEGGAWVGQTASFRFAPESYSTFSMKLDGQGGYEGLTAVMEGDFTEDCGFDIRGVVVDGDLPATPSVIAADE